MMKVVVVMLLMVGAVMVQSHLALMDPPARNVLWRSDPTLPEHPEDDYLICSQETGRDCPPCGDTPDTPRPLPHQAGGEWATGVMGRNYTMGETVTMSVTVTNSHKGPLVFKLCPNNDVSKPVTQKCLDKYPLEVVGYPTGEVPVTAEYQGTQEIVVEVVLPKGLECDQCVVQMTNTAEQFQPSTVMFRNCADVSIAGPQTSLARRQPSKRPSKAFRNTKDFGDASDFRAHGQREIKFPKTKSASKDGSWTSSADYSEEEEGYNYDREVIYQPWMYEDQETVRSKAVTRRQRQSGKPKRKSKSQNQALTFPVKSSRKTLDVSDETLAQFSGANKQKLLKALKKDNLGYSGYVQPKQDSAYRSRSKSMFPVQQESYNLGFGDSYFN